MQIFIDHSQVSKDMQIHDAMHTFLARTLNGFVPARSLIHASGDSLHGMPAFKTKLKHIIACTIYVN